MASNTLDGDRYSLDGLMTLYALEPSLRDVYVEGRSDAGLMKWYLQQQDQREVKVYPIDDRVEVPSSLLEAMDLAVGSRGRLIALASTADRSLEPPQYCLTAVIDADFHHIDECRLSHDCLIITDQPAIETYILRQGPLEKLLRTSLYIPDSISAEDIRRSIVPALRDLLATRFVLHRHGIKCVKDFVPLCELDSSSSGADIPELVRRSIGRVRREDRTVTLEALLTEIAEVRIMAEEKSQDGRGHDVAPLLAARLALTGARANPESLEMAFRATFSLPDLEGINIYEEVLSRLSAQDSI